MPNLTNGELTRVSTLLAGQPKNNVSITGGSITGVSPVFIDLAYTGRFFFSNAVIAAAGTTQATATPITVDTAVITPVAANAGVALPEAVAGGQVVVFNAGANTLKIYPINGGNDSINGGATTAPVLLPAGYAALIVCLSATAWSATISTPSGVVYNTNTATSGTVLTGANLTGGPNVNDVTLNMTGALGAGANAQLPTVANLVAAYSNAIVGQSYRLRIINSSSGAFAWTITTNTGWTLNGTMTIAQNTWRDFYITFTSLSAAVLQQIGTGTNS